MAHRELETDVLIVGGGCGGFAAALACSRMGVSCILTEHTDWLGGQLTVQAVPPDENRWIEDEMGVPAATGSYLAFRDLVRGWYRGNRKLKPDAFANVKLNPGNGWVSRLCFEPTVGQDVLQSMLAPAIASGKVHVLYHHTPVAAQMKGDTVDSVAFACHSTGDTLTISARFVLDATELGDLLPLTKTEYRTGAEAQSEFGELHAREDHAQPDEYQAISWCFALEHRPSENHTISKPYNYDFWANYTPELSGAGGWPGKLLSWTVVGGERHEPREFAFRPWPQEPMQNELEMWRYRRIVDRGLYQDDVAAMHPDVALINMVQMDYWQKPIIDVSLEAKAAALKEAKEQSLAFLYWMQTEAPRFDGSDKPGYPGLKLRGNEMGTADGFAKEPYIREARRLSAMFTITEKHVGQLQRRQDDAPDQNASPIGMGECFFDSVGIGHYRLDLHPSTAHRNSVYAQATPFRIPLGALIPIRVTNLLAAGKCLGVTHVTNGAYRLHPVEWNVGESAGALAAFCVSRSLQPKQVRETPDLLREFQATLVSQEVPISWPWEKGLGLE
jgi:FAD dependent oxidoreductase